MGGLGRWVRRGPCLGRDGDERREIGDHRRSARRETIEYLIELLSESVETWKSEG